MDARLLLLSTYKGWSERLSLELDKLGWRTITAHEKDTALTCVETLGIEAVLVDQTWLKSDPDITGVLRDACHPRTLPALLIEDVPGQAVPSGWDMVFGADAHAQQIALRIENLIRATVAEEEFALRRETLFEAGLEAAQPAEDPRPLRILSVGQPEPAFLAFNHSLHARKAEVVAAFSSYSAFDFLHDASFDSVVLWGGEDPAEALSVASGMRRNTRLYHTPIFLRLGKNARLDVNDAYMRGVNDLALPATPEGEMAERTLRLARVFRRQASVRQALEDLRTHDKMDTETGLFTRDLFAAHLARLSKASFERNRSLSVCVLKIHETPEILRARTRQALDRAMPQIGSMIARLIRAEDTAGRLAPELFALALPATNLFAARQVGERIAAVISCTAFEAGSGKTPFVVEFDIGAAQLMPGESVSDALTRAAAEVNKTNQETVQG
jgi:two-component system, cell cycle response regulator PopA